MSKPGFIALFFFKLLLLAALILPAACGLTANNLLNGIKNDPASFHLIEGVPFYPQNEYMCGPASMASVVGYWGLHEDMLDVAKEVYEEKLSGTLPIDLLIYAKGKGFEATYYKGSLDDLRVKISQKTPLILFLNLGYDFYPVGHYIVVTGYSDRHRIVIAHSGTESEQVFTYDELLRDWGKTDFSTLLITPKGAK